jgi:hypothetical protein
MARLHGLASRRALSGRHSLRPLEDNDLHRCSATDQHDRAMVLDGAMNGIYATDHSYRGKVRRSAAFASF